MYGDEEDGVDQSLVDSTEEGYCHFNENNSSVTFNLDLFGVSLELRQKPSAGSDLGHVSFDSANRLVVSWCSISVSSSLKCRVLWCGIRVW